MIDKLITYDKDLFIYLNQLGTEKYDFFWITVTEIINWVPLYIFFTGLMFYNYPKKQALQNVFTIIIALLIVLLFTEIIKETVARVRPNNNVELNSFIRILKTPKNYSFFSGHATSSFTIVTMLILYLQEKVRWIYLILFWPMLFASSRIYVGVHYPFDIIAGMCVGVFFGFFFYNISKNYFNKNKTTIKPL